MPANLENAAVATGLKNVSFHSNPKEKQCQRMLKMPHSFCFIDYAKAFDCMDHNKLWKILKKMGIPDHLICLLRNLYAGQEGTVRTGHGITDCFQIGKGVRQGCILSPCLFNFYAEYIMRNAVLEEAQAGIRIARRNINNLRYADDTTLMAESEEELKKLLMKLKEDSEKVSLKFTFRKLRSWHLVPSLHSIVNKAEIDVFLELSCFFNGPVDVGNLVLLVPLSFLKPA